MQDAIAATRRRPLEVPSARAPVVLSSPAAAYTHVPLDVDLQSSTLIACYGSCIGTLAGSRVVRALAPQAAGLNIE